MLSSSVRSPMLVAACAIMALPPVLGSTTAGHAGLPWAVADVGRDPYAAEVVRIRSHFDSVLRELRQADVGRLSESQRAARTARIAELTAYRNRGVFPHNHDFGDAWTPYFVDHRGVLCAVAHLLERSGRRDLVDRVATANNNVWVAELAGDSAFSRWLDESGLTLVEAARIQVPYVETPEESSPSAAGNRLNTAAAVLASSMGVAAVVWNARASDGERRGLRAALGFAAGALGLAVAASRMDADGAPLVLGVTTGAIGLTSSIMAARTLFGSGTDGTPSTLPSAAAEPVSVSIAPSIDTRGDRLAPGIALNVRF